MRKLLAFFFLSACAAVVHADESWMGVYMQGTKIGYAYSSLIDTTLDRAPAKKSVSTMTMSPGLMGQTMTVKLDSTAWMDMHGKPILITFNIESQGRTQKVKALFTTKDIDVSIDNSGAKSTKVIPLPKDANVVEDAIDNVISHGSKIGTTTYCYELDPMTVTLTKSKVTMLGKATTQVKGKSVEATKIEITNSQSTSDIFVTSKGDLVKVELSLGIEMLPESKEEATAEMPAATSNGTDLAFSTSFKPNVPIVNADGLKDLKLKFTGHDLGALPSDEHQTVSKSGDSWIVNLHPVTYSAHPASISAAGKEKLDWTKASMNLPSDNATFTKLAAKLTAGSKNVKEAAKKVHDFVFQTMTPNAGIGVLRDASEILKTHEGVCRDYAVLTATLVRAAHVPAQVVSGLVYEEGSFYYHAWVEVWDGSNWVGVDSTLPDGVVGAGHIELAHGSVEQAFTFTFLDRVKVEVLDAR